MKKLAKRIAALLLAAAMTVSLAACSNGGNSSSAGTDKSSAASSASSSKTENSQETSKPYNDGKPFEITILCAEPGSGVGASNLWFFKYAEWYLQQNGYNATIKVEGSVDGDQSKSLALATNNIPDLVWGIALTAQEAVIYGQEDGAVLDWTPYLTEQYMPNAAKMKDGEMATAFLTNTTPDGKIYGLPYTIERGWGQAAGSAPGVNRTWINTKWLEEVSMEAPKTTDDLLNVLRAFKEKIKLEDGSSVVPMASVIYNGRNLTFNNLLLMYHGFYGNTNGFGWGNEPAIKDGKVVLPCYTEEFKSFLTFMHTLYEEELISKDYFTMDTDTANALAAAGRVGVWSGNLTNFKPDPYTDWVSLQPLTSAYCDNTVSSISIPQKINRVWASASTKHPEALAFLLDLLYSAEGQSMYMYGPAEGEDPLNLVDGYHWDETRGDWVNKDILAGKYDSYRQYQDAVLTPCIYIANNMGYIAYMNEHVGREYSDVFEHTKDAITGEDIELKHNVEYNENNLDGYYRLNQGKAWDGHLTTVCLGEIYLSENGNQTLTDLKTVIDAYVEEQAAKFTTGARSLDEFDAFQKELEAMGIKDELALYEEGYATYMQNIFG